MYPCWYWSQHEEMKRRREDERTSRWVRTRQSGGLELGNARKGQGRSDEEGPQGLDDLATSADARRLQIP